MSTADSVYQGLANVGQAKATIGLAVAAIVASSLCASGAAAYSTASKETHTQVATGAVSNASCSGNTCSINATYTVGGKSYNIDSTSGSPAPSTIPVYYNPTNPADAETYRASKTTAYVLMSIGCGILLIGLLSYWLTSRFKVFAAAQGADTMFDFARQF
jgi:hypothetical protein